jgi:hypothetical protein
VEDEVAADRNVDRGIARALVGGAAVDGVGVDPDHIGRHPAWDPRVDDVDDAADRRGAEQQRRGAAQHFDALGGDRVDRDRMVRAGRRQVERADAVGQDANAVSRKAADYRRRGSRSEARRRNARLLRKRLANAWPDRLVELGLVEHRHAAEHVLGAAADAGDDDRLVLVLVRLLRRAWRGLLGRRIRRRAAGRAAVGVVYCRGIARICALRTCLRGRCGEGEYGRSDRGRQEYPIHQGPSVHIQRATRLNVILSQGDGSVKRRSLSTGGGLRSDELLG